MSDMIQPPPIPKRSDSSGALAWACLGLGIAALLFGLFVIGGLAGLAGLIVGIIHLKKHASYRAAAMWGVGLSVSGMMMTVAVLVCFWLYVRPLFLGMSEAGGSAFNPEEWIGKPVPALSLSTLDGQVINLADLKGHPAAIAMWASWHPACVSAVADFNRLVAETASQGGRVVAVSFEDAADVSAFMAGKPFNFPVVSTNDLPAPFGSVDSIPTTFFISTNGIILDIREGYDGFEAIKQSFLNDSPVQREEDDEEDS